jgi:predicted ATPase/DNA-binding winged helix-turn-helix (wHTH) protein
LTQRINRQATENPGQSINIRVGGIMPSGPNGSIYASGKWEVDLIRRELRAGGKHVPIGGRAFEIIEALVLSAGRLVTKDELIDRVWQGVVVEENALQVHISAIRKSFGADRELLQTVSRRGYRLLGTWTARDTARPVEALIDMDTEHPSLLSLGSNFAAPTSSLLGREGAVKQLQELVSTNRTVTLTGTGGIGKTCLALEVARSLLPGFDGGGWFVELNTLSDPSLVPSAVARILGLSPGGDVVSSASIARAIGKMKLLLVVDNCEHLVEAIAVLVETILRGCPNVSVLATSREVLRIAGECVFRVPPLEVPNSDLAERKSIESHSAVQLFVARTAALNSDLSLNHGDFSTIAGICRRLDGIPLAIEFAAARAATLGLQEVRRRLDDRFNLLTSGRRTSFARHRTLRATLDWSYELLPQEEQRLLRHLAVFAGGFTIEAANAVSGLSKEEIVYTADRLANLVGKSLVTLESSATEGRWKLLETIRAYAFEKLSECGEANQAMRDHARYFEWLVSLATRPSVSKPLRSDLDRLGAELHNVSTALDWSFAESGDWEIGVALTAGYTAVWLHFALMVECRDSVRRAIEFSTESASFAHLQMLVALGGALIFTMAPVDEIKTVLAETLRLAEELDDLDALLRTLWSVWTLHFNIGECFVAKGTTDRFAGAARRTENKATISVADRLLANTLQYTGQQNEARQLLDRFLESYVAPNDQRHIAQFHYDQRVLARTMLGRALWMQGDVAGAKRVVQQSFAEARTGHQLSLLYPLGWAVFPVNLLTGDFLAAEQSLKMLIDLAARYNTAFWKMLGRCLKAKLLIARGEFEVGHAGLIAALEECERTGWTICFPEFLGSLAEASSGMGHIGSALATIDRAIAFANGGGERWYLPELHRIKGELLVLEGAGDVAEQCLQQAIEISKTQGALFWELRGALSLARLNLIRGNSVGARDILEPIYIRFPKQVETSDLRTAASTLSAAGSIMV